MRADPGAHRLAAPAPALCPPPQAVHRRSLVPGRVQPTLREVHRIDVGLILSML